ncbi:MAG: 3-dehydroquinate synthase [Bacteroidales bacterium]|nr:3-dehydroquinate synthase [Bacteroidales bacterium]MBN2697282.1 3-dehydroquinate synthase [Bacteroidales bacterium]
MKEIILRTALGNSSILVGEGLTTLLDSLPADPILMVDEHVLQLHAEKFQAFRSIPVPRGEKHKTLQTAENLYRALVGMNADRSSVIVGVGGGLTTDLAGFVASTYMRGIRFGFIPTTLLAQVDAGIGGKNGVNLDGYKNMVGTINQPEFVWCDHSLLRSLDMKEYRSGIAEIIKYGVIRDPDLLGLVDKNMEALLNQEPSNLERVISECVQIKASIVMKDEKESGERRLLNFGHTIGHAVERHAQLLHGESISIGMMVAAEFSHRKGMISGKEKRQLKQILEKAGLPTLFDLDAGTIYDTVTKDKKKDGTALHFVFLTGLGEAVTGGLPLDELKSMLYDLREHSQ